MSYFKNDGFMLIISYFKVSVEDKAARELAAFQDLTRDLPETIALGLLVPFRSVQFQVSGREGWLVLN